MLQSKPSLTLTMYVEEKTKANHYECEWYFVSAHSPRDKLVELLTWSNKKINSEFLLEGNIFFIMNQ